MIERKYLLSTGEEGGGEDQPASPDEEQYLSQLASSVLGKKPFPYKKRVKGAERDPVDPTGASPDSIQVSGTPKPSASDISATDPERSSATPRPYSSPRPTASAGVARSGTFEVGTVLLFDDNSIGIYKDARPDKEYEVIIMMLPDGSVIPQGVNLLHYEVRAVGTLPPEFLLRIQRRKTWERDEIVFHLSAFDYCQFIPHPAPNTIEKGRSSAEHSLSGVVRKLPTNQEEPRRMITGREFTINFGQQEWHAVYWGEDDLGTVIAHNTNDTWALMHLDLRRFKESLVLGELVTPETMKQIRADLGS